MIRLATIGTSGICQSFLDGVAITNEFILSAVYSRNYATGITFAEKNNCDKVFTSLTQMAEYDGIDAVYIATPNTFHTEQSRIFLENGKHVICEKPIVANAKEYTELKALADSKGLIYMEAIIPRHVKGYKAVKDAFSKIGRISMARIDFCQYSSRMESFLKGEQVNIFDMSLKAGTLMDLGVYCVYAAVDFLGFPSKINAKSFLLPNGADGSGYATFDYNDFSAILTYSKTAQGAVGSEIVGEKGSLKIKFISQYAGVTLVKDGKEEIITEFPTKAVLMSGEAQKFADYILRYNENSEDYQKTSELCLNVHRCMDTIKEAAGLIYPDYNEKIQRGRLIK